jgi:Uncharacterized conserved protein
MKTVFHLSTDDTDKVSELLGNLKNLKEDETVEVKHISVVINGDGVLTLLGGSEASSFFEDQIESGVELKACSNSVQGRDINPENLVDGVETVSSGVGEVNRLQEDGFNYIKI